MVQMLTTRGITHSSLRGKSMCIYFDFYFLFNIKIHPLQKKDVLLFIQEHDITTIGILLGMAASHRGTMDPAISKVIY